MPRHIFIGDIHGCFDELTDLLAKVHVRDADVVVSLGDVVRKGPAPDRCLELLHDHHALAVLGNNDEELLRRSEQWLPPFLASPSDRLVLRRPDLLRMMRGWPLFLDFPAIGAVAVHGGVLPNHDRFGPELVPPAAALELRFIRRNAGQQWEQVPKRERTKEDPFWAEEWRGDRTIVYGHTPRREPRIDRRAIGIDTGCVYGGKLTAAVFDEDGKWMLEDVPARRKYAE